MKEERRRSVRIKKTMVVLYCKEDRKIWDMTHVRDISETGMQITTRCDFSPGDAVSLLLKIPSSPYQWLDFNGKVVDCLGSKIHHSDSASGGTYITRIEFTNLKDQHKEILRQYITMFMESRFTYNGPERRRGQRINANFYVVYHMAGEEDNIDITFTKNLCLGGMLLTTNRKFEVGTKLALEVKIPSSPYPVILTGKVLESQEVIKGLIYKTRIEFLDVDENYRKSISETMDYYLKKKG